MDASHTVIFVCIVTLAMVLTTSLVIMSREEKLERQGDAMEILKHCLKDYYLCGVPLQSWLTRGLVEKAREKGIGDYARVASASILYALDRHGRMANMYYWWVNKDGKIDPNFNGDENENGHYETVILFSQGGNWWKFSPNGPVSSANLKPVGFYEKSKFKKSRYINFWLPTSPTMMLYYYRITQWDTSFLPPVMLPLKSQFDETAARKKGDMIRKIG